MAREKPPDSSPFPPSGSGGAPADESREPRGTTGFMPEFVRKAAVAGLGALFLTEEGLRSLAGQLKLPKEMLGYLASQAERTKDEVSRILGDELRRFLQSERLREEWLKLLQGMSLEVKAEVRLVPSSDRAKGDPNPLSLHELRVRPADPPPRASEERTEDRGSRSGNRRTHRGTAEQGGSGFKSASGAGGRRPLEPVVSPGGLDDDLDDLADDLDDDLDPGDDE